VVQPKLLYVLRHAKSSWDDALLSDHDRPLSPRGYKAVRLLAEHVRAVEVDPALVLCSSARRTQETLHGVLDGHPASIEPELYGASWRQLIERLRGVPANTPSVMVIGHNPAVQMLVLKLATEPGSSPLHDAPDSALGQIERKFPTGALATLELHSDWAGLAPHTATLLDYVRPKALV
jgi:phosphohistidine phosphatase